MASNQRKGFAHKGGRRRKKARWQQVPDETPIAQLRGRAMWGLSPTSPQLATLTPKGVARKLPDTLRLLRFGESNAYCARRELTDFVFNVRVLQLCRFYAEM